MEHIYLEIVICYCPACFLTVCSVYLCTQFYHLLSCKGIFVQLVTLLLDWGAGHTHTGLGDASEHCFSIPKDTLV
jgi:hypothetical protein